MKRILIVMSAILIGSVSSAAAQDIKAGAKVYKKCKACHVVDKPKNKVGPHLINIIGRAAGEVEGYKYSKALIAAAEGGLVWSEEELSDYLRKPKAKIKGTKMSFPGLKKEDDVTNIMAYLKSKAIEQPKEAEQPTE